MLQTLDGQPQYILLHEEMLALKNAGVLTMAILRPTMIRVAIGYRRPDGFFERDPTDGQRWFAIDQGGLDPRTGLILETVYFRLPDHKTFARETGAAFALGEELLTAATFALDGKLRILESPLDWLRFRRQGLFVLDWKRAADQFRNYGPFLIPEALEQRFRNAFQLRIPRYEIYRRRGRP